MIAFGWVLGLRVSGIAHGTLEGINTHRMPASQKLQYFTSRRTLYNIPTPILILRFWFRFTRLSTSMDPPMTCLRFRVVESRDRNN